MLAQGIEWREEVAQVLPTFDQAHEFKRVPTERHQNDDPRDFGARAVQGLVEEFRRLMQGEAKCLRLLEVRQELFQRPWKAIRSDLAKLTCIDMDFTEDAPGWTSPNS